MMHFMALKSNRKERAGPTVQSGLSFKPFQPQPDKNQACLEVLRLWACINFVSQC